MSKEIESVIKSSQQGKVQMSSLVNFTKYFKEDQSFSNFSKKLRTENTSKNVDITPLEKTLEAQIQVLFISTTVLSFPH